MADPDDTSREDHARLQAQDIALYRRRSRLNFYEAACLARGFDPERFNGLCLSLIDREIMRDLIERGGAGAVAEYLTSAREIIMGDVGETITDLMKMTGSSHMQTSMPTPALAEMLEDLGLPLPFSTIVESPDSTPRPPSRQEQRVECIRRALADRGCTILTAPYGAKDRLRYQLPKDHPELFRDSSIGPGGSFDKAWIALKKAENKAEN